jgi:hypothetical protein
VGKRSGWRLWSLSPNSKPSLVAHLAQCSEVVALGEELEGKIIHVLADMALTQEFRGTDSSR